MASNTQPVSLQKAPAEPPVSFLALLANKQTTPTEPPVSALALLAEPAAKPAAEPAKTNIIIIIISIIISIILILVITFSIVTSLEIIKYKNILDEKAKIKTNNIDTNDYKHVENLAYAGFGGIGIIILLLFITFIVYILNINYFENYTDFIIILYFFIYGAYMFIIVLNITERIALKSKYKQHLQDIDDKLIDILQYTLFGIFILIYIAVIGSILYTWLLRK